MTMKRLAVVAVALAVVFAAGSMVAFAAEGTIVVTGGSLSVTPNGVTMEGVTLNGAAHNNVAGTTTAWTAKDATGTGEGWDVSVVATDFVNGTGKTIPASGFDIQVLDASVSTVSGNTAPAQVSASYQNMASAVNVLHAAADTGMGEYTFTPSFQLDVPADVYAGTYTSLITVTVSATP